LTAGVLSASNEPVRIEFQLRVRLPRWLLRHVCSSAGIPISALSVILLNWCQVTSDNMDIIVLQTVLCYFSSYLWHCSPWRHL